MTSSTLENPRIIPGPKELVPVISRQLAMYNFFLNQLNVLRSRYTEHGELSAIVAMPEGQKTMIFLFGSEYNQQVLSDPALFYSVTTEKLKDNAFARLNSGLANMNGSRHKQQRRLVMPAFHRQAIASYTEDMAQVMDHFLGKWQIGQTILTDQEMTRLVSRIVAHALFGLTDSQDGEQRGLALREWMNSLGNVFNVLIPYQFSPIKAKSEEIEKMILSIIEEKRKNPGNDVVSMLLATEDEEGQRLTQRELVGQVAILFWAGYTTTVRTLTWTLFLLTQHPNIYRDLVDELNSKLKGHAPSINEINDLKLLEAVLKETMRLLPPIPATIRIAQETTTIGGYEIGKDSMIILSHYITHRIPEIFTNPQDYNPERWSHINPSPYEYMPFSAGSRMCIGATFAMTEMKIVLSMMLQRFRFMLPENTRVDVVMRSELGTREPIPLIIQKPDSSFGQEVAKGDIHQHVNLKQPQ